MADGTVTLEFLGQGIAAIQAEMRDMRAEMRDMRTLVLATVEQVRRTDRHVTELRDELELMLKAEVMGRIGIFEAGVGTELSVLSDRVDELETGKSRFTP